MTDVNTSRAFGASGMTAQQYLASVIQGEARTPEGQFAVASVIQNRTDAATGGFGDTPLQTASQGAGTAYPQFSGFNPNYSANAYDLAGHLQNGTLSSVGDTGGANGPLFYNGPGGSSYNAYASGGSIIGGNAFSDQYGQAPSSNYVAPSYGGTNSASNAGYSGSGSTTDQFQQDSAQDQTSGYDTADAAQDEAQDGGDLGPFGAYGSTAYAGSGLPGTAVSSASAFSQSPNFTSTTIQDDTQGQSFGAFGSGTGTLDGTVDPGLMNASGDAASSGGFSTSFATAVPLGTTANPGAVAGQVGGLFTGSATSNPLSALSSIGGGGIPLQITDASSVGQQAGQDVNKGVTSAADTVSKAVQGATTASVSAGTSWISTLEYALTDIGIRGGLVLLALVLIAGAWVFYAKDKGGSTVIVPV